MSFLSIGQITRQLVAKARAGQPVTLADKPPSIATIAELDGFAAEARRNGAMTDDLANAIAHRRIALMRGAA